MIFTAQFRGRQGYLSSPSIKEWSIGAADAALMHVFIQILNLWTYNTQASLEMVLVINLAASLSLLLMFRSARLTSAPGPAPRKESSDAREEEPSSRQQRIYEGVRAYVRQCFGEYLSPAELEIFTDMLIDIRERDPEVRLTERSLRQISVVEVLRSRHMATRTLRKYNLYSFAFNMTGFLSITRREAAMILKTAFPNVFLGSSILSIDKSLTAERDPGKLEILPVTDRREFEETMLNYR